MENNKFFWKLGAFAKFDFKRFSSDAEKIKVRRPPQQAEEQTTIENTKTEESDQMIEPQKKKKRDKLKKKKTTTSLVAEEEIRHIRNKHQIKAFGTDIPAPLRTFSQLHSDYGMKEAIVRNVKHEGYEEPTAIQRQVIPAMLQGRDIMACAPTGSGKTAAFVIPILHHLKEPSNSGFRACILAPTRELAKQILREFRKLAKGFGLRSCFIETEKKAMKISSEDFDVLITTPNRLIYLLKKDPPLLTLEQIEWLIVDESDKLFEEGKRGFRDQLGAIYTACSSAKLHRAVFSATFAHEVYEWCKLNLDNVLQIYVGGKNMATKSVEQKLIYTGDEAGKLIAFRNLVQEGISPPVLLFVQSKERAKHLYTELKYDSLNVDVIHSDRPTEQRDAVVKSFRLGQTWVLICTELMGRGIDFKGVNLVVNYDFPTTAISYIHRVGRTGRAGRQGKAVTFFTDIDKVLLKSIANVIRQAGCHVPEYMIAIKKAKKQERRKLAKRMPEREQILTMDPRDYEKLKRKRKLKQANSKNKAKKQKTEN